MSYPSSTDFPSSLDAVQDRTDNVDIIWSDDYDFQDKQIRRLQEFLGETGKLIGENIAGAGPPGMVSPEADGGVAFTLAARNDFTSGSLLSIVDNFDTAQQELFRVNYSGLIWSAGGADFSDSDFLQIPEGASLPTGLGAGDEGRVYYKTGVDAGFYVWDGAAWAQQGGTWEGYMDAASNYSYSQAATPVEEVVGQFMFDGSKVANGMKAVFRCIMTPTLSVIGTADCRLYDLGPVGTPSVPRLVSTLQRTTSGLAYVDQDLTIVSSPTVPGTNEILDVEHMYEIVLYMSSVTADTIYLGSAGMSIEFA